MSTKKRKVTFLGTVVAGNSEKAAVDSFLRTLTASKQNKRLYLSKTSEGDVSFLTVASNSSPFSPLDGSSDLKVIDKSSEEISTVLNLPGVNELRSSGELELYSEECKECSAVAVSDNKKLLSNCIICHSVTATEEEEVAAEEEGDDEVDINIVPDDEELTDEELAMDELADDETISEDEVEIVPMTDELSDEEGELEMEIIPMEEDSVEDVELEMEEVGEETPAEEEEVEAEASAETTSEGEELATEETPVEEPAAAVEEEVEEEVEASAETTSEGDEAATDIVTDDVDLNTKGDTAALEEVEEEVEASAETTSEGEEADTEETAPQPISEEDVMQVDLLSDVVSESANISTNSFKLVYMPSESVYGSRWFAIVDDLPVAQASMESVGKHADIFQDQKFEVATSALVTQLGIINGLREMGFEALSMNLPVKSIVEQRVAKAKEEATKEADQRLTHIEEDVKAALSTACVGINKGFFKDVGNPVKAKFYDILTAANVENAEALINDAFCEAGEDYHKVLITKAFDLLNKSVDARNEISTAIANASYQNTSTTASASLSNAVTNRLGNNILPIHGNLNRGKAPVTTSANHDNEFANRVAAMASTLGKK